MNIGYDNQGAVIIQSELAATASEKFKRLAAQTAGLQRLSAKSIARQTDLLARAEEAAAPNARRVLEEMGKKHAEFNEMVALNIGSLLARSDEDRKKAYSSYLVQAWYHTKFTPEFERIFGERLADHLASDTSKFDTGNKFIRIISE